MNKYRIPIEVIMPYTNKGKIIAKLLKYFYKIVGIFLSKKWQIPIPNFEENPRIGGIKGAIYLGYKYYYKPHLVAQNDLAHYFQKQHFEFKRITENKASSVSISVGGDLMPYEWINRSATKHLWDEVGDWFFNSDIVIANLETPIDLTMQPICVPEMMLSDMHFNGSAEIFEIFSGNGKYKGYDLVATANNHSLDMGVDGMLRTMDFLEKKGVAYVGTSKNQEQQDTPTIIERNGIKIGFIAWTANLNKFLPPHDAPYLVNYQRLNLPDADLSPLIRQAKQTREAGADIIVMILHVGNAYQAYPSQHTVDNFHRIFEATGADVILGYHPHNAQPMEQYAFVDPFTKLPKKGFAIYSTADFVAYDIFTWDRMIPLLKLTFSKVGNDTFLSDIKIKPTYMWGKKYPKPGEQALRMLDLFALMQKIEQNKDIPSFLDELSIAEAIYLYDFCRKYFLPQQYQHLLAN